MGYHKPFWSYKFKKSGLLYEVGLCILKGDICWWSGPYAPGVWNDLAIFRDLLALMLEPGERCETDRGYQGSAPTHMSVGLVWLVCTISSALAGQWHNHACGVSYFHA